MIGIRLGPYEVTAKLGEGGMGEVFRARDTKLERDVAIKVLPAEFVEDAERLQRFEREAKLLAQLNHPNIAHIHTLEKWGQAPISPQQAAEGDAESGKSVPVPIFGLVMELVEGPTLAERLESGPLPIDEALPLARQIAEALEEAHDKGIIHRDLKPQNIKASTEGKVKVLDFGLAKAMDPVGAASGSPAASQLARSPTLTLGATVQGVILGTAAYMAPEQARGLSVDKRADIWAFGVIVWEMLTGRRLFEGELVTDVLASVLKTDVDLGALPAEVPGAIRRLLRRCLERNPKNRLHDIADARIVLDEVRSDVAEPEPDDRSDFAAARRRSSWGVAAVTLALGVVGTFGTMQLLGSRSGDGPAAAAAIQATIELPERFELVPQNRPLALSPDGRYLAVAGRDPASGNPNQLYLRSLDRSDLRPLAGTEGADSPFWSPDGRALGFFSAAKLKRIDLADGIVRTLCDAPAGRGGAWSPRGFLVFAPSATGPLSQVAETGGEPTGFTTLANEGELHRLPHFLPDGRRIVFYASGRGRPGEHAIYGFDPDRGEYRKVRDSPTEAHVVAPGWLAYVDGENLMAQPFDVERMATSGTPWPIVSDVHYNELRNFVSVALAANGALVAQPTAKRGGDNLAWLDRAGGRTPIAAEPMPVDFARIGPDGASALVSLRGDHSERSLELLDLERGIRTPLGDRSARRGGAAWSPDARSYVFGTWSEGQWQLAWTRLRAGDAVTLLTSGDGNEHQAGDITPDGRSLLYRQHSNVDKVGALYVVDLDGKSPPRPYLVGSLGYDRPRLSPDGRWAAFSVRTPGDVRYVTDLAIAPFPEATDVLQVTNAGIASHGWLGPGELYWVEEDGKAWAATVAARDDRLTLGTPRPLFGARPLSAGTRIFDYSTARGQFLVGDRIEDPPTNRLVVLSDWRSVIRNRAGAVP